jgi:hypothetical protein
MATIQYEKTYFCPPPTIDESTFLTLKNEFKRNSNYIIDQNLETFSEHFKTRLIIIVISFFVMIIGFSLGEGITTAIGGFAMLTFFGVSFNLLLEGRSYATYVKDRKEYFNRMSYAITVSNSYREYLSIFNGLS